MCMYDPPPLLGWPDLSAALICAVPLALSARRWPDALSSFVGLALGFLSAHVVIIAMHYPYPPSTFYWISGLVAVVPVSLLVIAYVLTVLFALSRAIGGMWFGEYRYAAQMLLLVLALVGVLVGGIYLTLDARALELTPTTAEEPMLFVDCVFPPFGEGLTGYGMLAVLIVFEVLVAVGIADAFHGRTTSSRRSPLR